MSSSSQTRLPKATTAAVTNTTYAVYPLLPAPPKDEKSSLSPTQSGCLTAREAARKARAARGDGDACYKQTSIACRRCRRRKTKCSGGRPSCNSCIRSKEMCTYDTPESVSGANKKRRLEEMERRLEEIERRLEEMEEMERRLEEMEEMERRLEEMERRPEEMERRLEEMERRLEEMERRPEEMQREIDCYKRIIVGISSTPETEAFETLRSFGAEGEKPLSALVAAVEAGMLRHPTAAEGDVRRIDQEALKESRYKLPAKPWTSVAGDGLVSHLITDHLSLDNQDPFGHCLSLLDPDLFLRDMIGGNPKNSQFCSHSLINTICGLRSLYSPRARQINEATRTDLAKQFAAEAAEQLETELEDRKGHVTTLQSLYYFSRLPPDLHTKRAGSSYYLDVLDYIKTCDLEDVILKKPCTPNPEDANERRALFKTYWAIFNLECIRHSLYLKIPAVKHIPLSPLPPYGPGTILDPTDIRAVATNSYPSVNRISHLLYRAMSYNITPLARFGEEPDMVPRRHFLFELGQLEGSLIPGGHGVDAEDSGSIQTKLYLDIIAYNVLCLLPSNTTIQIGDTTTTASAHLLALATNDITLIQAYLTKHTKHTIAGDSYMIFVLLWLAIFVFIPFLDDVSAHDGFTRGCALLLNLERHIPVFRTIRFGVLAVAWKIRMALPHSAVRYLEGLEEEARTGNVKLMVDVGFVIALPRDVLTRALGEGKEDVEGLNLGAVLYEWATAS